MIVSKPEPKGRPAGRVYQWPKGPCGFATGTATNRIHQIIEITLVAILCMA